MKTCGQKNTAEDNQGKDTQQHAGVLHEEENMRDKRKTENARHDRLLFLLILQRFACQSQSIETEFGEENLNFEEGS